MESSNNNNNNNVPKEFTKDYILSKSDEEDKIQYYKFWKNNLYKVWSKDNPFITAPNYAKQASEKVPTPFYDRKEGHLGGGYTKGSRYYDTTVGRKHIYWKDKDLPKATKDIIQLRYDMQKWGYCLIEDGLSKEQHQIMFTRLEEQRIAERELGIADMTPFFHIMWTMVNKGECFAKAVEYDPKFVQAGPLIEQLNNEILGPGYYAYSFAANVARPHCYPQTLHQDSGAIGPIQTPHMPVLVNTVYIMEDLNEVNGGTLVIPGSHTILSRQKYPTDPIGKLPPAINIEAKAGTIMLTDGRLLHGTGVNHTDNWRYIMTQANVKPFMKQQENWQLAVAPEVLKSASPKLLHRLGYMNSLFGLLESLSVTSQKSNVDVRLRMDEGEGYNRIGILKSPVPQDVKEKLTSYQLMKEKEAYKKEKESTTTEKVKLSVLGTPIQNDDARSKL